VPVRLGCRREDARGHASGSSLGATHIHERILPDSPGGRTGTQNGKAPALLGVSVADALLARKRAFVNRLSQLLVLVMGARFLWAGFAGP
jgi:hypothetical protein